MEALDFEGTVEVVQEQVFNDIMSGVRFGKICTYLVQLVSQIYARENALALKRSDAPTFDRDERSTLVRAEYDALERDVQKLMLSNMMGSREDGKGPQPLGEVVREATQLVVDRYIEMANKGFI